MSGSDRGDLATAVVTAVNSRDPKRLSALLHPDAEVRTGRSIRSGAAEVLSWADKSYDHLDRRYAVAAIKTSGDRILLAGNVEYVWRESGVVGDSAPIALTMAFDGDLLRSLRVDDDPEAALDDFGT